MSVGLDGSYTLCELIIKYASLKPLCLTDTCKLFHTCSIVFLINLSRISVIPYALITSYHHKYHTSYTSAYDHNTESRDCMPMFLTQMTSQSIIE